MKYAIFNIIICFFLLAGNMIYSQETPKIDTKEKKANIADKTKSTKKIPGLFTLYQDTLNGSLMMLIKKEQLNKEYIYFAYTENGIVSTGHNRGIFRDNRIFKFKKFYDRIELVNPNTRFYFNPNTALSKSSDANISDALLATLKIIATDSTRSEFLVDATSLYISETMHPVKPNIPPMFASMVFNIGGLNREKSKVISIRNYPNNTDVIVDLTFDNPAPSVSGGKEIADPRSVTIKIQHTLIELPENNYLPRRDDPRIGYFMTEIEDMTSASPTPYRDVIHRWKLEKKNPGAVLSDPVEPIVWWIENTTPVEFREIIKQAGLRWNLAFEKAGFTNAIKIEVQPDDADWDAGDIRYNVLRWTSSPNPPFGGYGPSFVNPRTGQIIGADIMFEYVFVTNRIKQEQLFHQAGFNFTDSTSLTSFQENPNHCCMIGDIMQHNMLVGNVSLMAQGASETELKEYIRQSLYYLVLHEMGHTLGLNHNMRASTMLHSSLLHNKNLTDSLGLTGSVMDYPAVNLALDKNKQGAYFTTRPGPYDLWAIEYGYSEANSDLTQEEIRLNKILSKSTDSLLVFGNDADDMRSYYSGIDPRVNINDLGKDVLNYSAERMQLVNNLMGNLKSKYQKTGNSYHELRQAYLTLTVEMMNASSAVSRYIGGVYTDRSFFGQTGHTRPYTPVSLSEQKKAMAILSKYIFAPDAFKIGEDLAAYLQIQRRGFNFFRSSEEPKIQQRIGIIQYNIIAYLTNPVMLARLSGSRFYGNKYTTADLFNDLTQAIFKDDLTGNVNIVRQELQSMYVNQLISVAQIDQYDQMAHAAALSQLLQIKSMVGVPALPTVNAETKAHRYQINYIIKKFLEK